MYEEYKEIDKIFKINKKPVIVEEIEDKTFIYG